MLEGLKGFLPSSNDGGCFAVFLWFFQNGIAIKIISNKKVLVTSAAFVRKTTSEVDECRV